MTADIREWVGGLSGFSSRYCLSKRMCEFVEDLGRVLFGLL